MTEQLSGRKRKCDVCEKHFTKLEWDDLHDFHEPDCPNYHMPGMEVLCDCDLIAHSACCPGENCHPKSEWAKANGY
jgi:hypothetical protein